MCDIIVKKSVSLQYNSIIVKSPRLSSKLRTSTSSIRIRLSIQLLNNRQKDSSFPVLIYHVHKVDKTLTHHTSLVLFTVTHLRSSLRVLCVLRVIRISVLVPLYFSSNRFFLSHFLLTEHHPPAGTRYLFSPTRTLTFPPPPFFVPQRVGPNDNAQL